MIRLELQHLSNYSPFLHYWLVPSLEKINIGNAGNQNHPDLEVRVVLVTCISNIDFSTAGNQSIKCKNGEYNIKIRTSWATVRLQCRKKVRENYE